MTKWFWLFLAFYMLVGQPALIGWMLENSNLYQLSLLNCGVLCIWWIISALCRSKNINDTDNNTQKSEQTLPLSAKDEHTDTGEKNIADEDNENDEITETETIDEEVIETEKKESKKSEKIMKESVAIPKIVHPLTGKSAPSSKRRKKEKKWGQWLVLLSTLWIAAVIAFTLWEFLWSRGVAISLFLGWLLYLLVGKLFDINGFHKAKKLFTNRIYVVLILWWIGYWAYSMQQSDFSLLNNGWWSKWISYIKDWFNISDVNNDESDEIYVFEWTGELLSNSWLDDEMLSWDMDILSGGLSWAILSWEINIATGQNISGDISTSQSSQLESNTWETQTTTLSTQEANKQVTMWEAVKALLSWYTLSTKTNITFRYVAKSNELYPYFKTAQEKTMLGTDTDPSKIVSCDTFITMKWILEWRNVGSYTSKTVKSVYWNKAAELWKLNGCEKWKYVKRWNL